jgi:hypothetical protein
MQFSLLLPLRFPLLPFYNPGVPCLILVFSFGFLNVFTAAVWRSIVL